MSWYISGRGGNGKFPLGSITMAELHAVGNLVPLLAQPELHNDRVKVAALNADDHNLAQMLLAAIRSKSTYEGLAPSRASYRREFELLNAAD